MRQPNVVLEIVTFFFFKRHKGAGKVTSKPSKTHIGKCSVMLARFNFCNEEVVQDGGEKEIIRNLRVLYLSPTFYFCSFGPRLTLLRNYSWGRDAQDQTWVGREQGKCPTHLIVSPLALLPHGFGFRPLWASFFFLWFELWWGWGVRGP